MADMIPVVSSAIAAVAYDPEEKILVIQFHKRGTWAYDDVPQEIFDQLTDDSGSVGEFFNQAVRPRYTGHVILGRTGRRITTRTVKVPARAALLRAVGRLAIKAVIK